MYGFSRIVLDHAQKLTKETIPSEQDPRVPECIATESASWKTAIVRFLLG